MLFAFEWIDLTGFAHSISYMCAQTFAAFTQFSLLNSKLHILGSVSLNMYTIHNFIKSEVTNSTEYIEE